MESYKKGFKAAFPKTLPVLTGFLFLGIAYGVLMKTKGYGALWSVLMSILAFCGSMQYVAITLLTAAFNPLQAFFLSLLVNARHLFYGISMLKKYKGLGKLKWLLVFWMCDETFSVCCFSHIPSETDKKHFYFAVSLLDYTYWVLGTLLGSIIGNYITFNTTGLDFVLTALFTVLFTEQLIEKKNRLTGIIGVLCTIVCLVTFGSSNFVIPSMVLIVAVLLAGRKKLCI